MDYPDVLTRVVTASHLVLDTFNCYKRTPALLELPEFFPQRCWRILSLSLTLAPLVLCQTYSKFWRTSTLPTWCLQERRMRFISNILWKKGICWPWRFQVALWSTRLRRGFSWLKHRSRVDFLTSFLLSPRNSEALRLEKPFRGSSFDALIFGANVQHFRSLRACVMWVHNTADIQRMFLTFWNLEPANLAS